MTTFQHIKYLNSFMSFFPFISKTKFFSAFYTIFYFIFQISLLIQPIEQNFCSNKLFFSNKSQDNYKKSVILFFIELYGIDTFWHESAYWSNAIIHFIYNSVSISRFISSIVIFFLDQEYRNICTSL